MDYEIVQPNSLQDIQSDIRDRLWKGKQLWMSSLDPSLHAPSVSSSSSFWSRVWTYWFPKSSSSITSPSSLFKNSEYHPEEGLVAVGQDAWDALLLGVQEGCLTPPFSKSLEHVTKEEKEPQSPPETELTASLDSTTPIPPPPSPPLLSMDHLPVSFPLPSLGYIPGRSTPPNFFGRLYAFFHSRWTVEKVGGATLAVVFGETRTAASLEETEASLEQLSFQPLDNHPDLTRRLSVYV